MLDSAAVRAIVSVRNEYGLTLREARDLWDTYGTEAGMRAHLENAARKVVTKPTYSELEAELAAARIAISDVTRERDEAMEEFRYQSTEHGKALHALGSLQELLAKQIAVPKSSGALACAACGWPNDKHPDDCPVKRGLEIIERALGEADLAPGLNAAKSSHSSLPTTER